MFLCCGGSSPADEPVTDPENVPENEKSMSPVAATDATIEADALNEKIEAMPPSPPSEEMDYARARREAEERELERTRSEISGVSVAREDKAKAPLPLRLSLGEGSFLGSEREGSFLGLPPPRSPRIEEQGNKEDGDDDWAKGVLESVSRAGSTYGGEASRPCTPVIAVEEMNEIVSEKIVEVSVEAEEPKKVEEVAKVEEVEAPVMEQQQEVEKSDEVEPQQVEQNHIDNYQHTSLYISADHAASFMNFDASIAPPTPAASFSGSPPAKTSQQMPPPRADSPAPSFAVSIYDDADPGLNSKRASTISTISTIAAAAASAALARHASVKRHSNLSTYSYASYQSRPTSPAPPTNNRLSQLRGSSPATHTTSRLLDTPEPSASTAPSSDAHLLPYLAPLTSQLLPRLDKLLSTTSILSHYARWETAMSLRREVRAFVASGVDDFLDADSGQIMKPAALEKAVEAFLIRGRGVGWDEEDTLEGEDGGRGGFGDVRAFWAGEGGRGSGVVAV